MAIADEITAIWDGPASSFYKTASNWIDSNGDPLTEVPLNNDTNTYNVIIPNPTSGTRTVTFDQQSPISGEIVSFALDTSVTLNLTSNSSFLAPSLTVLDDPETELVEADIRGFINAGSNPAGFAAHFSATGAGSGLNADRARLSARLGSTIAIGGTSYETTGLGSTEILRATNPDSKIELASLETINAGTNTSGVVQSIHATDSGMIDLSSVHTLNSPVQSNARVDFNINTAGHVDLSSLSSINPASNGEGQTRFNIDGATLELGPLNNAKRARFIVGSSGTVTTTGTAASGEIVDSTFEVSDESQFHGAALQTKYSALDIFSVATLTGTTTLMSATGDSTLDLSGLQSINAGFDDADSGGRGFFVSANLNSIIDLSNVTTLTSPARAEDRIEFTVDTGATINLSSLESIIGPAAETGRTKFDVNSGIVDLGPLQTVDRAFVTLSNAAIMSAGGSDETGKITNSVFWAEGGSQFNGSTMKANYVASDIFSVAALTGTVTLMSATNDSTLDLSGLQSINAGFDDADSGGRAFVVSANFNGTINLSNVTSVIAPARSEDGINFVTDDGGVIDLSSLRTIDNAGAGRARFTVNDGLITVDTVDPDTRIEISVTGADSSFTVLNEVILDAPSTLKVEDEAVLRVGGNFQFTHTTESNVDLTEGIVHMNGDGRPNIQTLEAGGVDLGSGGSTSGNFGIGQLIVGEDGQATIVEVIDDVSNGNRGANDESEALYLFGIGNEGEQNEQDGLRILAGSRLVINKDVNIYAFIDADMNGVTDDTRQWEHLNDWFVQLGVDTIPFDGGVISTVIPEPGAAVTLALLAGPLGLTRRRVA